MRCNVTLSLATEPSICSKSICICAQNLCVTQLRNHIVVWHGGACLSMYLIRCNLSNSKTHYSSEPIRNWHDVAATSVKRKCRTAQTSTSTASLKKSPRMTPSSSVLNSVSSLMRTCIQYPFARTAYRFFSSNTTSGAFTSTFVSAFPPA